MKGLVCKYCGGNHFNKTEEGYECDYCHTVYELDETVEIEKKSILPIVTRITPLLILVLILGSYYFIFESKGFSQISKVINLPATNSKGNERGKYSVSQLKNPERNVRIAELSLNQEEINLAKASIAEYGGEQTGKFEQRLADAQNEHDQLIKNQAKEPPKKDMIIENPDSEFSITTYYREAGFLAAFGPDFDQYTSEDILRIWGNPDEIITDTQKIKKNLVVTFDENSQPTSYEAKKNQSRLATRKFDLA
ncbi:DUF4947 domain-containing protein [Enterococcus pseudoavium]|uniref:DUF4947 domain-containing protein n=1 Tax=Enterococcus pseudoavium TaxID=44007 RepID=UPI000AB11AE9|nr:DUF4947 domain-containing protein [Enterococcus pseudoavium]